ncbi:carbohydrate ABC transporter permease [Mahella australiensis]|uniref:Binding-protein-dependent transport systems inner membrane component n=1 Tax=Mahella australiensis (strain DSM 15567 / CIP 107919 / 50-1 BON) TaxID=697281 RepID=F3ZWH5_MAHA5|nr:sugar ABC transporter permease [Mahella australiensis]AEE95410.1 binding-protein-dependent transport systems inner membrane component [Mahella australiensis 50-1 BON]
MTEKATREPKRVVGKGLKKAVFGKTYAAYFYIAPAFIFLGIFTYYAMAYNIHVSFFEWNGVSINKIFIGLNNYTRMFKDPYFILALKNTAIYFVITVPVQAVFGLILAYCFQQNIFAKGLARSIIFLPNVMALVVIGYVFSQMFNYQQGFINELLRQIGLGNLVRDWTGDPNTALYSVIIANIYTYVGFSMTLYIAGIVGIPKDVLEAAQIDGGSEVKVIRYVILPLLRPTHITVLILGIVGTLKTFDLVWLITKGGPGRSSEMLATLIYRSYILEYKAGYAAAISVIVLIIALGLSCLNLYIQRQGEY